MDQVDASLEVINLICATLLFIYDVTKDTVQLSSRSVALLENHAFLEAFADICFSDVTGILRDARISPALVVDVQNSLHSWNKALAAHREAWRYVGVASEVKRQPTVRKRSTITFEIDGQKKKFRDEMKQRSQIWKERATPGLHSTLFEQEEMDSLVAACHAWTDRLRHTLSVILLVAGETSPHFPANEQAAHLGIAHMLERQRRLGLRPSQNYMPLTGQLRKPVGTTQQPSSLIKTVYTDGSDEIDILVEVRPYSDTPAGSVRQLTWYLSASSPWPRISDRVSSAQDGYNMLTLGCLGFMEDASNARSLILYRSPQSHPWASNPQNLHDIILKGWNTKLSLDQRFRAARTLAASVLDIHTSGSLHSNIKSQSIAMLPRKFNDPEPSPFLLGWGVEPPQSNGPSLLEPNLYHHHTQFGQSCQQLTTDQDVYSLGIVLLEIGLWTTMSTVFAKLLETTPRFGRKEEKATFKRVNRVVLDLAHSADLRKEIGARYAGVVQKCLEWKQQDAIESMLVFRKEVVDMLDVCCRV